jgi:hypothetical protein
MILLVCQNKNAVSDFVMLADIEFVMQLEALDGGPFGNQLFTIIDMTELNRLGNMKSTEVLYLVCHGDETHASIGSDEYEWTALGRQLGPKLPGSLKHIENLACDAASPPMFGGKTPLRKLADGIGETRQGVKIRGYLGPTVTNTAATVTAREQNGPDGPVLVIDDSTKWHKKGQKPLLKEHDIEIQQFNSWCSSNKGATLQDKAIVAAEMTWKFYVAYAEKFVGKKYFFQAQHNSLRPVVETS